MPMETRNPRAECSEKTAVTSFGRKMGRPAAFSYPRRAAAFERSSCVMRSLVLAILRS